MALRLRRGTDAERTAGGGIVFAEGELVYITDTEEVYVGDGVTPGGIRVTGNIDASPAQLTQNLDLNGFNISGNGTITATAFVGDGSGLTGIGVEGTGVIEGQEYIIDIQGDVRGADSSIIVDSLNGVVYADFVGDGSLISNISLNQLSNTVIGTPTEGEGLVYTGGNWVNTDIKSGTFSGTFNGAVNGFVTGDVKGSVFADDSSLLVDGISGTLTGDVNNLRVTTKFIDQSNTGVIVVANFFREESSWAGGTTEFSKHNHGVTVNGTPTTYWANSFSVDQMLIVPQPALADYGTFFKIWNNGKVMINGDTGISGFDDLAREPDSQLDIYGVMKLSPRATPPATAVEGMIAVADRVNWDPAGKGSGNSYPAYFDGTAWVAMA